MGCADVACGNSTRTDLFCVIFFEQTYRQQFQRSYYNGTASQLQGCRNKSTKPASSTFLLLVFPNDGQNVSYAMIVKSDSLVYPDSNIAETFERY
mmetsp:Transcript_5461/g.15832  ORF Transcript_5461/g.15832 Transcript_5461/m.15832 type:complete len:95 (-) Transcript_5461:73-357(-)